MRFNVVYNGKRTTARLPDELWELFIVSMLNADRDEAIDEAISEIESFFKYKEQIRKDMDTLWINSASVTIRGFITGWLRDSLRSSAPCEVCQ